MTSKTPLLKTKAFMARDRLFGLITGARIDTIGWRKSDFDKYFENNYTIVNIDCTELDKYGRVLANVSNFADVLVNEKLAYRYDGGTKLTETEILSQVVGDT
jgi:hypothetical protein